MRKVGRFLLLAVLLAGCLSLSACSLSYTNGSKQIMDQMNIVATLANNGDMTVSETWKVRLLDRGRDYSNLYRSFSLDKAKVDDITNVRVTDNDRNLTYTFAGDIDPENAEDTAGLTDESYLHQSDEKAEIGWFMPPIKEGTRTFTITYTLKNIVSVHTDTAVLYNFFLPQNFSMPVTNLTGTIRFPSGGSQSAVRAWLHTTAVSNLTIASANTIRFSASSLPPSASVEVRLCMPPKLFAASTKISGDSVLPGIEKEEQNWAKEYADEQRRQYLLGIADAAGAALILIASIITLILVRRKYRRHKVDALEYVREIPQGNSPGGVAHLFYFYSGIGDKEKNRIYSATLLSLARKGFLSFSSEDKKNISIRILGNTRQMQLTESEGIFFEMISTVGESENNSFTMKQFKKYAKEHYTYIDSTIENFLIAAKRELTTRGFYESRPLFLGVVKSVGILMFLAAFAIFVATARLNSLFVYLPLSLIFGGILLVIAGSAKMRLSVDGEREYELWHGLKRYMLDFSRMKEYGVPELTLWEEYLVYATMMGISEEVCKQLKLVYPQLNDTEGLDRTLANSYLYYMFWPRYSFGVFGGSMAGNFNFGAELGKSMGEIGTAATRLAHPPAGGNGGFGNGGFGGFGGGGLGGGGFGGGGGGFGGGGGGGVR